MGWRASKKNQKHYFLLLFPSSVCVFFPSTSIKLQSTFVGASKRKIHKYIQCREIRTVEERTIRLLRASTFAKHKQPCEFNKKTESRKIIKLFDVWIGVRSCTILIEKRTEKENILYACVLLELFRCIQNLWLALKHTCTTKWTHSNDKLSTRNVSTYWRIWYCLQNHFHSNIHKIIANLIRSTAVIIDKNCFWFKFNFAQFSAHLFRCIFA